MAAGTDDEAGGLQKRSRGRPRVAIDRDAVADAAAQLFAEGGYEAVSVANTADKLGMSRATLYRAVPTKEDLLGILFERSTAELTTRAQHLIDATDDPREQLAALIRLQADASVRMPGRLSVFFESGQLPPELVVRWRRWGNQYERTWISVVAQNVEAGALDIGDGDPRVATRLIFGMLIWVGRWYRPTDAVTAEEVAETATRLLGLAGPHRRHPAKPA